MCMSEKVYEDKFNKIIQWIIHFVGKISPSSFFCEHGEMLNKFIADRPEEPIAYFIKYVYNNDEYRTRLHNMDDAYFLHHNFDEIVDKSAKNPATQLLIGKLFNFKDLWIIFDDAAKIMIKKAMRGLVVISENYIDVLCEARIEARESKNIKLTKTKEHYKSATDSISIDSTDRNNNKDKHTVKYVAKKKDRLHKTRKYDSSSISIESSNDKERKKGTSETITID